jgi:voltage-gated potassium channel Kch
MSSSRANKPPTDEAPSRDQHGARSNAVKAVVAVPATIFMPFIVLYKALRSIWSDRHSRGILIVAVWLLVAGTIIFMIVEGFSPIDSFYFSFITLATIGYGDFVPSTELSRLVTVAFSIAGLGIMAALVSTIATQKRAIRSRMDARVADEESEPG